MSLYCTCCKKATQHWTLTIRILYLFNNCINYVHATIIADFCSWWDIAWCYIFAVKQERHVIKYQSSDQLYDWKKHSNACNLCWRLMSFVVCITCIWQIVDCFSTVTITVFYVAVVIIIRPPASHLKTVGKLKIALTGTSRRAMQVLTSLFLPSSNQVFIKSHVIEFVFATSMLLASRSLSISLDCSQQGHGQN